MHGSNQHGGALAVEVDVHRMLIMHAKRQAVVPPVRPGFEDGGVTTSAVGVTSTTAAALVPVVTTTAVATTTTTTRAAITTTVAPVETTTTPVAATTTTVDPVETTSRLVTTTTQAAATTERDTTTRAAVTTTSAVALASSSSSSTTEVPTLTRTSIVVVSGSSSTVTSISSGTALAGNNSGSSSGVSTGAIAGIVAGSLLAVIVLAALIGYTIKKKRQSDDNDEPSPFDKEEFRRTSAMLDDDDDIYGAGGMHHGGSAGGSFGGGIGGGSHHGHGGEYVGRHSPQMSEYSMHDLGRSNTIGAASLPGLARGGTLSNPRPPTAILNHYQHQQHMMPSFQPGQVMPSQGSPGSGLGSMQQGPPFVGPVAGGGGGMDMYGGYPMAPAQRDQLDRSLYAPQHVPHQAAISEWPQRSTSPMAYRAGGGAGAEGLERGLSNASSAYSVRSNEQVILAPPNAVLRSSPPGHGRLSLVQEEFEALAQGHGQGQGQRQQGYGGESRSGTPTNSNVQQSYFSHGRGESVDYDDYDHSTIDGHGQGQGQGHGQGGLGIVNGGTGRRDSHATTTTSLPGYEPFGRSTSPEMHRRRLSVRNQGNTAAGNRYGDDNDDDAYGGM